MGDMVWLNISQSFKEGLLELITLDLIQEKPDTPQNLMQRIQLKTNIWLNSREVHAIILRLSKRCMIKQTDSQKTAYHATYEVTDNGKEQIADRVNQMERFISLLQSHVQEHIKCYSSEHGYNHKVYATNVFLSPLGALRCLCDQHAKERAVGPNSEGWRKVENAKMVNGQIKVFPLADVPMVRQ